MSEGKEHLKVYYSGHLNQELDDDLDRVASRFGYERWASGYNLVDGVRDLAYEKDPVVPWRVCMSGPAVCHACDHEWTAVLEGRDLTVALECPSCGEMEGIAVVELEGDQ